ncbi:hypothetical protein [Flagellimonas sp. 2504JD4-2]
MGNVTQKNKAKIQELLIRMDRNHTIIQTLSKKLNSYTCEPHDSSCFEKFYALKHSFKQFDLNQNRIMDLLKKKSDMVSNLETEIKEHLKRFDELEKGMAAYLLATNKYF